MTEVSLEAIRFVKRAIVNILEKDFLFYSLLLLFLLALNFFTDFNGLYGQDAHEYFRYSKALHEFFVSGKDPGDYFWPVIYPLFGAFLSFILPNIFSMQLISILSLIVSCFLLEKILDLLYQKEKVETRMFVLLFFFLSPYVLRASIVVMSDMLALMFILAAFYFFYKYWYFRRHKYFFAFVVFSTAASATRYGSFVVLFIPVVITLSRFIRNFSFPVLLGSLISSLFIITPHLLIRHSNPLAFLNNSWLNNWSLKNFFSSEFTTQDGHAQYLLPNVVYAIFNWLHPAFIFPGFLFLLFLKKLELKRNTIRIVAGSILLYAFFVAGIPYQNFRFLLLSFPLVLIVIFPAAMELFRRFLSRNEKLALTIVILIQVTLFIRVFMPFYHLNKFEKEVASAIKSYPANYPVYTFEMEGALRSYNIENSINGLWDKNYDSIQTPAMLLFNENKFSKQWTGTNVMANYKAIKKRKVTELQDLGYGWKLSKIE